MIKKIISLFVGLFGLAELFFSLCQACITLSKIVLSPILSKYFDLSIAFLFIFILVFLGNILFLFLYDLYKKDMFSLEYIRQRFEEKKEIDVINKKGILFKILRKIAKKNEKRFVKILLFFDPLFYVIYLRPKGSLKISTKLFFKFFLSNMIVTVFWTAIGLLVKFLYEVIF